MNKDIYFTKEWAELSARMEKGCASSFSYSCSEGCVSYTFIKKKRPCRIDNQDYYDIVSPGGFGGPNIAAGSRNTKAAAAEFEKAFEKFCIDEHIVTEHVRFSPVTANALDFQKYYDLMVYEKIYCKDLRCEDIFTGKMSPKMQNDIKKAQENGVAVSFDFTGESAQNFIELFHENGHSYDSHADLPFIKEGFEKFPGKIFIVNAVYRNKLAASGIFLNYSDIIHCHYLISSENELNLNAGSIVIYTAALWGKRNSKKYLDIGSLSYLNASELSLFRKDLLPVYEAVKIRMPEIDKQYNMLTQIKTGITTN